MNSTTSKQKWSKLNLGMSNSKVILRISFKIYIKHLEGKIKLAQNYKNRLNDFMTKMIK